MSDYPRRLIEVDLPIKRISAHARREKSIRHGHISTLHIWWARRPLAACRAVICAALWPDPADPLCPQPFRDRAARLITSFAKGITSTQALRDTCSEYSLGRWLKFPQMEGSLDTTNEAHLNLLRYSLLDFIADFANWDNSTQKAYLETARALTQAAHEALGGAPGTRPLVVDPFAGGGAIPLEALRVGADAFASDLNPVAVLLNKVVLEYIPRYGQRLADEVRRWGEWVKKQAEKELAEFYPKDPDGATPIAYLWARTIQCEGPGCGAQVPLMRSLWLAKKGSRSVALKLLPRPRDKRVDFEIIQNAAAKDVAEGTVRRGSAACACCGYTTPVASVRRQLRERGGGAADARLFAVVTTRPAEQGRFYRLPAERDLAATHKAKAELERRKREHTGDLSLVPDELLPLMSGVFNAPIYGHETWGSLFTPRQALAITAFVNLVREVGRNLRLDYEDSLGMAIQACLALIIDRVADRSSSLCRYDPSPTMSGINNTFARQALPMIWDFGEGDPTSDRSGGWGQCLNWLVPVLEKEAKDISEFGTTVCASVTEHPLPNDSAHAFITDPPYYNAVPYADLSDFFYVWLRRAIGEVFPELFSGPVAPKEDEICEMAGWDPQRYPHKDGRWFEEKMTLALSEGRRILAPSGIGLVVFAHKTTSGWESLIKAMVDAGWMVTGSWPIDTEMGTRLRAMNSAALASSIHLVCRPRENPDGSVRTGDIGDWRDVLQELPGRIHQWMPRLAREGIVGADAIFACLGPALEVFSRYSRVEKANGEQVALREYLEYVWAAVAREGLNMIFEGAETSGLEEDARLTAMWLWTLSTGGVNGKADASESSDEDGGEGEDSAPPTRQEGFTLEYDAVRKIAQGLGAHLERLPTLVEIKGDKARLLPVSERARFLFGREPGRAPARRGRGSRQLSMFEAASGGDGEAVGLDYEDVPEHGKTVLDRIHQSMVLFASGRGQALGRFLVDEGVGRDQRFWSLAQALSALYPPNTEEKRWVDGVLARKRALGF